MNTVGFIISAKENEKRRALIPVNVKNIKNKEYLFFEKGYGDVLGFNDDDYINAGANVASRSDILKKDVICDPKIGDADYLGKLVNGQMIFGWVHAVQNTALTDEIIKKNLTAIAWEDMFYKGRHVFWRNNELSGEAAIMHAFSLFGRLPYECNVALIGKGNVARGAYKALSAMGATVTVYDRNMEQLLRDDLYKYDVIVNGVLWDVSRVDHLIYKEDLHKLRKPAIIIDISCDKSGAIETSRPTSIENPIYTVNNVIHYAVDHTPALFSYSVSKILSCIVYEYIDDIVEGKIEQNKVLDDATIIKKAQILDRRIIEYQNRK